MKRKLMSVIVTFCILLALAEEMSVEAAKLNKIKKFKKDVEDLHNCCVRIKCFSPHKCKVASLSPITCRCIAIYPM